MCKGKLSVGLQNSAASIDAQTQTSFYYYRWLFLATIFPGALLGHCFRKASTKSKYLCTAPEVVIPVSVCNINLFLCRSWAIECPVFCGISISDESLAVCYTELNSFIEYLTLPDFGEIPNTVNMFFELDSNGCQQRQLNLKIFSTFPRSISFFLKQLCAAWRAKCYGSPSALLHGYSQSSLYVLFSNACVSELG